MKFYQSSLLNQFPDLLHTFTTKKDGNIAFHVGEDKKSVLVAHKLLGEKHSYDSRTLIHMKQIHSNKVHIVTENESFEYPPSCDALVTNKKNTPLMVMVADCSALLFYDNVQKVIGVVHAGRAGAFNNIVQNLLDVFTQEFHSKTKDIYVSISPAICQNCYEVGKEIEQEAKSLNLEYAIKKEQERYYLNIRAILEKQLLQGGLQKEHIEVSPLCNACNTQTYYSYRKEGQTGRFSGVLMLK